MFKFKLEPVLSLKEKVEENKKRELGIASRKQEVIQAQKRELECRRQEALKEVQTAGQAVDVRNMRLFNAYHASVTQSIELKSREYNEAQKELEVKRKELLDAVQERKILDNLKSIHYETFLEEEKSTQQNILDEIVTYKYGRREKE